MKKQVEKYRGRTFYKLLLSFFVLIFFCTSILTFLYIKNISDTNQTLRTSYEDMAKKMMQNSSRFVSRYGGLGSLLAETDELKTLAGMSSLSEEDETLLQFHRRLDSVYHSSMSGPGNVVYIQFQKAEAALSLSGRLVDENATEITENLGLTPEDWRQLTGSGGNQALFIQQEGMTFSRLMVSKEIYPDVLLIAAIAEENLTQLFQSYYLPAGSEVVLYTGNHNGLVFSDGENEFRHNLDLALYESEETTVIRPKGSFFLYRYAFPTENIHQAILIPDSISGNQSSMILTALAVTFLIWVFLGTGLSYFLATFLYRPVEQLISNLPVAYHHQKNTHEFSVIGKVVQDLYSEKLSFEQQIEKQNRLLGDHLLTRLLQRTIHLTTDIERALEQAGFPKAAAFVVAFLAAEVTETQEEDAGADALKICCDNVLETHGYTAYSIPHQEGVISVLRWEEGIYTDITAIQQSLESQYGKPISISLSNPHSHLTSLPDAYEEALHTMEYTLFIGEHGTVCRFSEQIEHLGDYSTSSKLLNKISKLIYTLQAEDFEQVISSLEKIFDDLEDSNSSMNIVVKQMEYIVDTILIATNYNQRLSFDKLKAMLKRYPLHKNNLQEIRRQLYSAIEDFQKQQIDDSRDKSRIEKIVEYIEGNYADPNITAATVAEKFNISISWMSYLFKKERQTGFLDSLHKCRIDKAKTLLLTTDQNIGSIAHLVGYSNAITMTRAFKRYEGITPSWYRSNLN